MGNISFVRVHVCDEIWESISELVPSARTQQDGKLGYVGAGSRRRGETQLISHYEDYVRLPHCRTSFGWEMWRAAYVCFLLETGATPLPRQFSRKPSTNSSLQQCSIVQTVQTEHNWSCPTSKTEIIPDWSYSYISCWRSHEGQRAAEHKTHHNSSAAGIEVGKDKKSSCWSLQCRTGRMILTYFLEKDRHTDSSWWWWWEWARQWVDLGFIPYFRYVLHIFFRAYSPENQGLCGALEIDPPPRRAVPHPLTVCWTVRPSLLH